MEISAPQSSSWTALWARTALDEDPVERPLLAPHLRSIVLDAERVLLCSDDRKFALRSPLYVRLVPLLDGSMTRTELIARCAPAFTSGDVAEALKRLAERGFIVAHATGMSNGVSAFWTALGVSPAAAAHILGEFPVSVLSPDGCATGDFEAAFRQVGGTVADDPDKARVRWVLVNSYFDSHLPDLNSARIADGRIWGLTRPGGLCPLIGPLFRPGAGCWRCLEERLRGNLEVDAFLGEMPATEPKAGAAQHVDTLESVACRVAALQLAKALVIEQGGINDGLIALNALTGEHLFHRFPASAGCPACNASRPARDAMRMDGREEETASIFTSGGYRAVDPMETVFRHRHLIDPLTGIVSQLLPLSAEDDDWNRTFLASHGFSSRRPGFEELRHSLRSKSSGKGTTRSQSMASALCEAIERYSGIHRGHETAVRRRYADFPGGQAIHPNAVMLFSERQYATRDRNNQRPRGGQFTVPPLFAEDVEMDWTPVHSLRDQEVRYAPTELLYYYYPSSSEPACLADSNGASAGNTVAEAIVQGFLELIERDAYAIWWYNGLRVPAAPLEAFGDPYLDRARPYYAARNREIWLLDVSADSEVAVYVAVSRRTDKPVEDVILGAGAHFQPRIAALRAVTELNQHLLAVEHADMRGEGYNETEGTRLAWWRSVTAERCPWILPEREQAPADGPPAEACGVSRCVRVAESLGVDLLVLNQTRVEAGLPVAKVLAPGLRHFWPRFAPGRLYEVPVKLGRLPRMRTESELVDVDVFV